VLAVQCKSKPATSGSDGPGVSGYVQRSLGEIECTAGHDQCTCFIEHISYRGQGVLAKELGEKNRKFYCRRPGIHEVSWDAHPMPA
jgi:hypothetical protein